MGGTDRDQSYQIVHGSTIAAAFLQVWGCPVGRPDGPRHPEEALFANWGVVATLGGIVVDAAGIPHSPRCPKNLPARPVTPPDLLRIPDRVCTMSYRCASPLAAAGTDQFVTGVAALSDALAQAMRADPPVPGPPVAAERRTARLGATVDTALRAFRTAVVAEPGLEAALEAGSSWVRDLAEQAQRSVRRDGLRRLTEHLEATLAGGAAGGRRGARLRDAERATAGTAGGHVVCMFDHVDPLIDIAVAAAPAAASAVRDDWLGQWGTAVAVLPRELAVYLNAVCELFYRPSGPMVFSAAVDPHLPGLRQACQIAVQLWTDQADQPEAAWRAALAAAA